MKGQESLSDEQTMSLALLQTLIDCRYRIQENETVCSANSLLISKIRKIEETKFNYLVSSIPTSSQEDPNSPSKFFDYIDGLNTSLCQYLVQREHIGEFQFKISNEKTKLKNSIPLASHLVYLSRCLAPSLEYALINSRLYKGAALQDKRDQQIERISDFYKFRLISESFLNYLVISNLSSLACQDSSSRRSNGRRRDETNSKSPQFKIGGLSNSPIHQKSEIFMRPERARKRSEELSDKRVLEECKRYTCLMALGFNRSFDSDISGDFSIKKAIRKNSFARKDPPFKATGIPDVNLRIFDQ